MGLTFTQLSMWERRGVFEEEQWFVPIHIQVNGELGYYRKGEKLCVGDWPNMADWKTTITTQLAEKLSINERKRYHICAACLELMPKYLEASKLRHAELERLGYVHSSGGILVPADKEVRERFYGDKCEWLDLINSKE